MPSAHADKRHNERADAAEQRRLVKRIARLRALVESPDVDE
jgi:hypothetical protein